MTISINDWQRDAACTSHDPELFFPIGHATPAQAQLERARRICRSCPVQTPCLEWALRVGVDDGVWGGLDEQERRSLRRRQRSGRGRPADQRPTATAAVLAAQTASRQRTADAADGLSVHARRTDAAVPTP